MKKLLIFVLAVIASAPSLGYGATRYLASGDLPYMITQDTSDLYDTIATQGNLTSASTIFFFDATYATHAHDLVVNCTGDTITWGTGGASSLIGIAFDAINAGDGVASTTHGIKLIGGTFLHAPSGTPDGCRFMNFQGYSNYVGIEYADIRGTNAEVIVGGSSTLSANCYDLRIHKGTLRSYCNAYTSRCNYDGAVVELTDPYQVDLAAVGATYHLMIDSVTIVDGPGQGIVVTGRSSDTARYMLAKIIDNTITLDARNTMYGSYSGTCNSCANPYGILARYMRAGTEISGNVIRSGTAYGGCRGIDIEYGLGTPANPIYIKHNDVDVHEGPNVEFGTTNWVIPMRVRYFNAPSATYVDSNTFIGRGDSASATTHTGQWVTGMWSSNTSEADADIRFRWNQVRTISTHSAGVFAAGYLSDEADYDSSFYLTSNNIKSSGRIYQFGGVNHNGMGTVIVGDTVGFEATTITGDAYTYYLGYLSNSWNCANLTARDVVYVGAASDDDITFSPDATTLRELTSQSTLSCVVQGSNSLPVVGADVAVVNAYGDTVLTGVTDSGGVVSGICDYAYYSKTGTELDSTFNPFSVEAQSGSDSTIDAMTVGWTAAMKTDTLTLASTIGTGVWGSTGELPEPPAPAQASVSVSGNVKISGNVRW
jgi:hypothetical protein